MAANMLLANQFVQVCLSVCKVAFLWNTAGPFCIILFLSPVDGLWQLELTLRKPSKMGTSQALCWVRDLSCWSRGERVTRLYLLRSPAMLSNSWKTGLRSSHPHPHYYCKSKGTDIFFFGRCVLMPNRPRTGHTNVKNCLLLCSETLAASWWWGDLAKLKRRGCGRHVYLHLRNQQT